MPSASVIAERMACAAGETACASTEPPRVHVTAPLRQPEAGRVFVAPSGRMSRYDQAGFELQLYEQLAGRLVPHGVATVRFDIEDRKPSSGVSSSERQKTRSLRLAAVLERELASDRLSPILLLGASLGAQSVIEFLGKAMSERIKAAILIGCIAEAPATIVTPLNSLTFLYGERDLVAYSNESGDLSEVTSPVRYGPETAENMIVLPRTRIAVEILPELGHLLERPKADSPGDDLLDLLEEQVRAGLTYGRHSL
jgi:hypothetical protein